MNRLKTGVYQLLWMLLLLPMGAVAEESREPEIKMGGAACVMAKWRGNTLDYVLIYGKDHPLDAIEEGENLLRKKGFDNYVKNVDIITSQATSNYPFAYVIVVKTSYKTKLGKLRTSYGCGFSPRSYSQAQWRALKDLQSYSWGWTPKAGFEVVEQFKYQ